jgi:hypothetical protein
MREETIQYEIILDMIIEIWSYGWNSSLNQALNFLKNMW